MPLPKDPQKAALARERMRLAHLGKKLTPEQKKRQGAAISAAKKGKPRPDMRGDGNPMRKPDVVARFYKEVPGYDTAHGRIERRFGKAPTLSCGVCGLQARDWALLHEAPSVETCERTGYPYSLNLTDYIAMCRACHRRYDCGKLSI